MTLKGYLTLMSLSTLLCWGAWIYILFNIDPETSNYLGFVLFYATLFLSLSGTFAILGLVLRFVALKRKLVFHFVGTAFRQSFLFSFLILAILFLQARGLLTWLNLIFLAGALVLLEFFWLSYNQGKAKKYLNKN